VLRISADAFDQLQLGVLFGSFVTVLVLFIVPVTLMGTASPFAIRLAMTDSRQAGSVSGKIYAISTLGSFLGTFLPVLVFIPTLGTFRSFMLFAATLMIVAMVGLWLAGGWRGAARFAWMPVGLALLAWFGLNGPYKATTGQVFEKESAYNYIQVLEQNGFTVLRLNDGQGVHSIYKPDQLDYHGPWEQVLVAPFFNSAPFEPTQVQSIAIVGLAAGTTARQATSVYGPIPIDGFEIDPAIIDVGKHFFDMNEPNLNAIVQDGRWGLEHSSRKYTIISVDAYRPPYIPEHLTTREFFLIVRDHLTEDGVMAINVGRSPTDRSLIDALASTIHSVFPSVYVMDIPETFNSMIYATAQPTKAENLTANLAILVRQGKASPLLVSTMTVAAQNLQPTPEGGLVFTDDLAPIEWITNRMILNYIISGDMETLK
jgi:spermidine synthase